jgi:cytoskeletal protein RodZ
LVGEILRKKREESGQDLRDISNVLRIKYDYLKSLEEGSFEKLPQEVYVKGYIREYAEYLQIDPQAAIDAYVQQIAPSLPEQKETLETAPKKRKRSKAGYLFLLVCVILVAIPLAYKVFQPDEIAVSDNPQQSENAVSSSQPGTVKGEPSSPAGTSPKPVSTQIQQPPLLPSAQATKETVRKVTEPGGQVLKVFATDTTWILVRIDSSHSKEMILKPGESAEWHAEKGFSLTIGNASGIRLLFNGKEMKNLGEKGQVIKIDLPDSSG